jgi:hypothetical protein
MSNSRSRSPVNLQTPTPTSTGLNSPISGISVDFQQNLVDGNENGTGLSTPVGAGGEGGAKRKKGKEKKITERILINDLPLAEDEVSRGKMEVTIYERNVTMKLCHIATDKLVSSSGVSLSALKIASNFTYYIHSLLILFNVFRHSEPTPQLLRTFTLLRDWVQSSKKKNIWFATVHLLLVRLLTNDSPLMSDIFPVDSDCLGEDMDDACGESSGCINRLTQVECSEEECRSGTFCKNQR